MVVAETDWKKYYSEKDEIDFVMRRILAVGEFPDRDGARFTAILYADLAVTFNSRRLEETPESYRHLTSYHNRLEEWNSAIDKTRENSWGEMRELLRETAFKYYDMAEEQANPFYLNCFSALYKLHGAI